MIILYSKFSCDDIKEHSSSRFVICGKKKRREQNWSSTSLEQSMFSEVTSISANGGKISIQTRNMTHQNFTFEIQDWEHLEIQQYDPIEWYPFERLAYYQVKQLLEITLGIDSTLKIIATTTYQETVENRYFVDNDDIYGMEGVPRNMIPSKYSVASASQNSSHGNRSYTMRIPFFATFHYSGSKYN